MPGPRRKVPKRTSVEPEPIVVAGHEIVVSNPSKVLFPKPKYTKLDLVRYYLAVAVGALRGAGGRPNVLVRYPNGIDGEFFYQKRAPESRAPRISTIPTSCGWTSIPCPASSGRKCVRWRSWSMPRCRISGSPVGRRPRG